MEQGKKNRKELSTSNLKVSAAEKIICFEAMPLNYNKQLETEYLAFQHNE